MKRYTKRTWVLLGVISVVAAIAAAGAYAYWTNGGTGSGTATVGTADDNLVLSAEGWADIQPGQIDNVDINIDNTANTYDSYVKNVVLDSTVVNVDGTDDGIDTGVVACDSAWFNYAYTGPNIDDTIGAGLDEDYLAAATLEFENSTTANQDACKGASVKLNLVVDNS